jgi:hypothetical protein
VARCPSENVPPNVALLARRIYGRYLAPRAEHLRLRTRQIEAGEFRSEIDAFKTLPVDELRQRYTAREIET